jgi:drug/metabolite transporter (DMT)-like permease
VKGKWLDWFIFTGLCLIWGSSFILIKRGMFNQQEQPTLNAFHVGALRMLSAGIILLPLAFKGFKNLSLKNFGLILISALCGSFFPSFLFCIAETKINSALAGTLNALTPLFVIIIGALFFNNKASAKKTTGVVIGLAGSILLFLSQGYKDLGYIGYALFVLLATIFYGINVNTVQRHLKGVSSIQIASIGFITLIPASLLVLYLTGFFNLPLMQADFLLSTIFASILGVVGTAFATIIFYILVKRTSALFASLVTYGIPFVAIGWGLITGEDITLLQIGCLGIILLGVYIANRQ